MIPLIVIICIIAIVAILLSIKVTLKIVHTDKLAIYLKIFFIKIKLHPKKKKKKKYKHSMSKKEAQKIKESLKKKPKKKKKKKKEKDEKKEDEGVDTFSIISIIVSFVKNFIMLFLGAVRIKASRLKIIVATDDAAKTALTYTAVTQSINALFPLLDSLKAVKRLPRGKELSVDIDYLSDESKIDADIELYIRVGGALGALCKAAIRAFKKAVKNEIKKLERKR